MRPGPAKRPGTSPGREREGSPRQSGGCSRGCWLRDPLNKLTRVPRRVPVVSVSYTREISYDNPVRKSPSIVVPFQTPLYSYCSFICSTIAKVTCAILIKTKCILLSTRHVNLRRDPPPPSLDLVKVFPLLLFPFPTQSRSYITILKSIEIFTPICLGQQFLVASSPSSNSNRIVIIRICQSF